MRNDRRRFLKTAWGAIVLFGSGMVGIPLGCRSSVGARRPDGFGPDGHEDLPDLYYFDDDIAHIQELTPEELARLPELTDQEAQDFLEAIDAKAEELKTDLVDASGNPLVPPGQHVVETIPIMATNADPRGLEEWRFTVTGEVENELEFTLDEFLALPHVLVITGIHCVTSWTALDVAWEGVRPKTLYDLAGLKPSAQFVISDCEHGYTTNVDLAETLKENVLIATRLYGQPLPQQYGGPVRGMIPDRYFYKSGKWLTGLRILDHDEPGYWETKGYSNTAYAWENDRYS